MQHSLSTVVHLLLFFTNTPYHFIFHFFPPYVFTLATSSFLLCLNFDQQAKSKSTLLFLHYGIGNAVAMTKIGCIHLLSYVPIYSLSF